MELIPAVARLLERHFTQDATGGDRQLAQAERLERVQRDVESLHLFRRNPKGKARVRAAHR